jgi:hypothetical protein
MTRYNMNDITYITEQQIQGVYKTNIVPRSNSATGYGKKIPTQYMLKIDNRLHRVYCMIFSNSGSCYIVKGGKKLFTGRVEHMFDAANVIDNRYNAIKQGESYMLYFCNEWIGSYKTIAEYEAGITSHYNNRH